MEKEEKNEWNEEKNDRKLYNNDEIPKRSFTHTHTVSQLTTIGRVSTASGEKLQNQNLIAARSDEFKLTPKRADEKRKSRLEILIFITSRVAPGKASS